MVDELSFALRRERCETRNLGDRLDGLNLSLGGDRTHTDNNVEIPGSSASQRLDNLITTAGEHLAQRLQPS